MKKQLIIESQSEVVKNVDEDLAKKIRNENIKVHSKEAAVYDTIHSEIFNKYEQKRVIKDIEFITEHISLKDPSVLDVGCGTGNLSLKLLKYNFSVTGVDISKEMLNILRSKTRSKSLALIESDVDSFISKCKEKYDIIIFSSVLHHLPDYLKTIKNATNLLKENGIIYITHEPKRQIDQKSFTSLFWKVFTIFDSLLFYTIILRLKGVKIPHIDYTWSDYHSKQGIDLKEIINYLKDNNFQILQYEGYNARKFAILSIVDNKFNRSKCLFKLIAKRTNNDDN